MYIVLHNYYRTYTHRSQLHWETKAGGYLKKACEGNKCLKPDDTYKKEMGDNRRALFIDTHHDEIPIALPKHFSPSSFVPGHSLSQVPDYVCGWMYSHYPTPVALTNAPTLKILYLPISSALLRISPSLPLPLEGALPAASQTHHHHSPVSHLPPLLLS